MSLSQHRHTGMYAGIQYHGWQLADTAKALFRRDARHGFTSLRVDSGIHAGMTNFLVG